MSITPTDADRRVNAVFIKNKHCFFLNAIFMMNIFDAFATTFWIITGTAVEKNPFMDILIDSSPIVFISTKLVLVSMCIILLWRMRENTLSRFLTVFSFMIYSLVSIIHVRGIMFYAFGIQL